MKKIEKNSRVMVAVPAEFSSDKEITGRVVWHDEHKCIIVLDPKYQSSEWGWKCNSESISEYSLPKNLEGRRLGIVPNKECTSMHTIKNILEPTTQRRL